MKPPSPLDRGNIKDILIRFKCPLSGDGVSQGLNNFGLYLIKTINS
jgi:hypothetical protein